MNKIPQTPKEENKVRHGGTTLVPADGKHDQYGDHKTKHEYTAAPDHPVGTKPSEKAPEAPKTTGSN
jgi:hypothetical protein